jgi:hypothetical protein
VSKILKIAFDNFGLSYFEKNMINIRNDVVGLPDKSLVNISDIPNTSMGSFVKALVKFGVNASNTDFELRKNGAMYCGHFTVAENPKILIEVAQARANELDSIKNTILATTNDPQDHNLKRVREKRHKTFKEFEEIFKSSFLDTIYNQIRNYEKLERRRKDRHSQDNRVRKERGQEPQEYIEYYETDIEQQRSFIRQREDFIEKYSRTPEGYKEYLRERTPIETFAFFLQELRAYIPKAELARHWYIPAISGGGKSEFIKMQIYAEIKTGLENLEKKQSNSAVVLIEPHGDLSEEIARFKEFAPQNDMERLVYLDPFLKDGYTFSINPFDIEDKSERVIAITSQELKRVIGVMLGGSAETTNQMNAILEPCIAVLLRRENSSFEELQDFFDDNRSKKLVELGLKSPNLQHRKMFTKWYEKGLSVTKHGLYMRMQVILNDPIFQNLITRKTTVNLKKLIDEKKVILFRLPKGEVGGETGVIFGKFLVGLLRIMAMQRSKIPEQKRVKTAIYIDEVQNYVSGDLETMLSECRKYKMRLILANQRIGQGEINTDLRDALLGSGVVMAGMNEPKSLKAIEQKMRVKMSDLESLQKGQFYLKIMGREAVKIIAPKFLIEHKNTMTAEEWGEVVKHNIKNYYSKIEDETDQNKNTDLIEEIRQSKEDSKIKANINKLNPKYEL